MEEVTVHRATSIAGVALIALAALAAACGSGEEAGTNTATPPAASTQTPAASPTSPATFPEEVQLTQSDDGTTVQLAAGGTLIIALPANPDAGEEWSVSEETDDALALVGEPRFVPSGSTNPVEGAPGTQVFTFTASETPPAQAEVVLEEAATGGTAQPARAFSVTVEFP